MGLGGFLKKLAKPALKVVGGVLGGPLGSAIGGAAGSLLSSSKNKNTAQNYAQRASWQNSPISMPGLNLGFDQNGNPFGSSNTGNAQNSQWLGQFGQGMMQNQQNYLPFAQNQFDQSSQILGDLNGQYQGIAGGLQGMLNQGLGNQFSGQSSSILGSLGSFDPNQLASSYANNLRQQAQPDEQNAAQNMAQQLFNTGRLGSSGGAQMMGQLGKQMQEADINRTIAGQQYAGQEQSRLAGMAQGFGQTGQDMNTGLYGALSGVLGQQGNMTNQRFTNAMNLFGGANQQNQANLAGGLNSMNLGSQVGQQDIQSLMQMMAMSNNMSANRANVNAGAYAPQMQAGVAQNNSLGTGLSGILGAIGGQYGWGASPKNPMTTPMSSQYFPQGIGIQGLQNPFGG